MISEEDGKQKQSSPNPVQESSQINVEKGLFSPRFRSVAALAGWDEESILVASLIAEDTPDRCLKHKRLPDLHFKTPPSTNSRRKRRDQKKSPISIPVPVLDLDEEEPKREDCEENKLEEVVVVKEGDKKGEDGLNDKNNSGVSCSDPVLPCMDKLREELSCAICLEICFEPSTTSCGHSFCKKCLRSAADKCGKKCPKCRQLISNGRSCIVNTVLWNTIQLLFPQEVEARRAAAAALNSREAECQSSGRRSSTNVRSQSIRLSRDSGRDSSDVRREMLTQDQGFELGQRMQREELGRILSRHSNGRRRRGTPTQDEDAALALRLQREEFMETFRETHEHSGSSLLTARANLRAMASRAINSRVRGRT